MPRRRDYTAAGDVLPRIAAAIVQAEPPEDPLERFLLALESSMPGLRAWLLRRDAADADRDAVWIPGTEAPFPANLIAQAGSAAASVLVAGRPVPFPGLEGSAQRRCPEAPYLRRRGGCWLLLPLPSWSPVGVLVLGHAEAEALEAWREAVERAARLVWPHIGLLLSRQETERRVEERTRELALFYETSRALAFARSAEEIVSVLGRHLGPALGLRALALLALRHDRRQEVLVEVTGAPSAGSLRSFVRVALDEAASALGAEIRPVRVRINRPARLSAAAAPGHDLHAALSVQGRATGSLSARTAAASPGESRTRLFYTIAGQAALTLERIRTVEEAGLLKIRAVLDSMREGVLLVDRGLGVILANPAAQGFCADILGGPLPRRLRRLGGVALAPILESLASGGGAPGPCEIVSRASERLFQLTASPVSGLKGALEGAVLVLSDVTEQRRIQEQLLQSEKLSSLGEMISGVAHELNNPLASIIGYAQLLEKRPADESIRRKVSAISSEASRCHRIVQNLLRFARKQAPERSPVDLNSVIGSAVQLLGYQLQADNIILDVDLHREMRPLLGDSHALQQVFVNIINNAHHAMKQKPGQGVLRIVTRCDGLTCRAEIADTGPGIKPEHLKRIFDPFFSTKGVGQGTGLGLSIAYATVKDHGGTIFARSRLGRGTTFVVELPASAPAEEAVLRSEAAAVTVERPPAGRRILVVEDETSLSMMICEALAAEGHLVDAAPDGLTARQKIAEGSYDLIISDLKMPNMSGRELYETILSTNPALAQRIIFSTGDSVSAETRAFFEKVGNPYLTKPFNLSDLFRVVNTALRQP